MSTITPRTENTLTVHGAGVSDALHAELGPAALKPTAITPGLQESSTTVWSGSDDSVRVGLWSVECGSFHATRVGHHEIFYVLAGRAMLQPDDGPVVEVATGDVYVTPCGWSGTWTVTEPLRKLYVITDVA